MSPSQLSLKWTLDTSHHHNAVAIHHSAVSPPTLIAATIELQVTSGQLPWTAGPIMPPSLVDIFTQEADSEEEEEQQDETIEAETFDDKEEY